MLTRNDFYNYQHRCVDHMLEHPKSMLFVDPGLGKSVVGLTVIDILLSRLLVYGVLVTAPKRVCQSVWRQEALKWAHTRHLSFSMIMGTKEERIRALMTPADVYLINYDNLVWLQAEIEFRFLLKGKRPPFNMLVADEVSKLKGTRIQQGAERGRALLKMTPYLPYRTGLTGTPAGNGLQDLFGQYLVIDSGERLGTAFSTFQSTYFYLTSAYSSKWYPFERSKEQISELVHDITINLNAEDYLDILDPIINDVPITMPPKLQARYDSIEHEMMIELDSGIVVDIDNEGSKINRCLQFSNGALYKSPGNPDWETIHDVKLDALDDVIEEIAGKPVLIAYQFKHDAHKIMKRHPDAVWLSSKTSEEDFLQALTDWKEGKLTKIIAHGQSMGHGIDGLQGVDRHLVWYGIPWSKEVYDQTIARLWGARSKQNLVVIHRLIFNNTVDEVVRLSLEYKEGTENDLRTAIDEYREGKGV